jgi:hypothetical protein
MRLNRLRLAAAAALAVATPAPAHALDLALPVSWSVAGDGSVCFSAYSPSAAAGLATAVGIPATSTASFTRSPSPTGRPFAAAAPIVTTGGPIGVCLGGDPNGVFYGAAEYTFDVHGTAEDFVTVVHCTFGFYSSSCI